MRNTNIVDFSRVRKILVIQFRPFGDVLLATSYLEALKKHFVNASLNFLVKKPFDEILFKNPWLSRVIAFEQRQGIQYLTDRVKLFLEIRRQAYDLVIDQQNGMGSGQVALLSGAGYKLGWSDSKWGGFYNLKAVRGPIRYRALQNFEMLFPLGIAEQPCNFFFHIKTESDEYVKNWLKENQLQQKEYILISPGSPRENKKWHAGGYAALSDLILRKTKMKVVLLRGPKEYKDCHAVINKSQSKPLLAPPTTFNQAAALVKNSCMLICNDGGINHLSVALNVPSLAIFGNTSVAKWSPQGYFPQHYHLVNPEWKKQSDNRFGITPEAVFQKVLEIL